VKQIPACFVPSLCFQAPPLPWLAPFAGPFVDNNPGALNAFIKSQLPQFGGYYYPTSDVQPELTTRYLGLAIRKPLLFLATAGGAVDSGTDSDPTSNLPAARTAIDKVLCAGHAVIVQVESPTTGGYPGHYVLVFARKGDDYSIVDPVGVHNLLISGYGRFRTRGYVQDPTEDRSGLYVSVGTSADILVTDASNRHTGLNSSTSQELQDIPGSGHFVDRADNDIAPVLASGVTHSVGIFRPACGTYEVAVGGLALGTYSLLVSAFSEDGSPQPPISLPGIAALGSASNFQIEFVCTPGDNLRAVRLATFGSTLADISNSLQLGLIDRARIADHLSDMIEEAAKEAAKNETEEVSEILREFKEEVSDRTPRDIKEIAAQILLEDAVSLLGQLPKDKDDGDDLKGKRPD